MPATYIIHSHATRPGTIVRTLHRGEHAQRITRPREGEKERRRGGRGGGEGRGEDGDRGRGIDRHLFILDSVFARLYEVHMANTRGVTASEGLRERVKHTNACNEYER